MEIAKTYEPKEIESKWYPIWEKRGYFTAEPKSEKPSFCIAIPPPNVTGYLHMGHALQHTLMDTLTRWRRMQKYNTLWLPGTDHAGISTQIVVERRLWEQEKLTRKDLGREEFERRIWEWKEHAGGTIQRQIRKEGASCDWTRERFTLDDGLSRAVKEVFVRLYEEGLIYRGAYMVNWCPKDQTALSDLEAPKKEVKGKLYHIAYPIKDSNERIIVATTRPETMLGDTGIAIHPSDERYKAFHEKYAILPLVGKEIPFVCDEIVEMEFGTGVVKVTPAHDPNDFRMGLTHNLQQINVIDKYGKMTEAAGSEFVGLDRSAARKLVLEKLEAQGFLVKVEDYTHKVGHCQRCDTVLEPLISTQWFAIMKPLAEEAIKAVKDGRTQFIPENWTKVFYDWLENIQDWCISRQLWWGHRIPAWYCQDCPRIIVARETPTNCPDCNSGSLRQDEDVLDTWFSSALWPFSTLGWPDETDDLKTFYPTTEMLTGFDIIFFWVARMMMMGLKFMGDVPFKRVYITGLVRVDGEKMSKMKGNVVDPLDVFERYGTDAVRFTLAGSVTGGTDVDLQEVRRKVDGQEIKEYPKMEAARNFANKIWNASRFVLMNLGETEFNANPFDETDSLYDKWILSRLNHATADINEGLDQFRFYDVTQTLYHFFWNDFCDWYIELAKPVVTSKETTPEVIKARQRIMYILEKSLRLLHPVMPYITEELWQMLPHGGESISVAEFPKADRDQQINDQIEEEMRSVIGVITKIRNIRSEMNLPSHELLTVKLGIKEESLQKVIKECEDAIKRLAKVKEIEIRSELGVLDQCAKGVISGIEIAISLAGLIDLDKERERLGKELAKIEAEMEKLSKQLSNPNFVERAQADVVEKTRTRLADLTIQQQTIKDTLAKL